MSEHVFWNLHCGVKPGQLDTLKALMAEMVAATQADEPGALNYEWSLSDGEQTLHLFERYADSAAAMVHLGNFGTKFAGRFMAALDVKNCYVYGSPNDDVKKALGGIGATFFTPIGGFSR